MARTAQQVTESGQPTLEEALKRRAGELKDKDLEMDGNGIAVSKANARLFVQTLNKALLDSGFMAYALLVNQVVMPLLADDAS